MGSDYNLKRDLLGMLQKTPLLVPAMRAHEWARTLDPRIRWRNAALRRQGAADGLPLPPLRLVVLVAGSPELGAFLEGGKLARQAIEETLGRNDLQIEQFESILDFGCGCGRVLRQWQELEQTAVHGSDYNPELVAWCQANLGFAQVAANKLAPPLPYPEGQFDFIYALSVLTHLPEPLQLAWLAELRRVLRPGGYALVTTHGSAYLAEMHPEEMKLFQAGKLAVRYEQASGTNLCATFHPFEYMRDNLLAGFDLVDYLPEGARGNLRQDIYLLQKVG